MNTFTIMSLVTSVKDYVEITHKLIEIEPLKNYTDFGAVFTYFIFSIGDFLKSFLSFSFFKNIWSIPIIIPDIASAMISEVSVIDGYFHNAFTVLETNIAPNPNLGLSIFEKLIIGLINSFFLFLPTSTSHLITLRRFVMQGLEAGYMAGLGTLAGNFLWLASIILGLRFFIIPWLSLDIFRYFLGFILLVKYIWDSSKERRSALEDLSKWKIFLLNFLLALTEQSCIYPFISNISIGPDVSVLEGFPVENYMQFLLVHGAYLLGILLGSFSLLQFTCWFWENPAFSIYLWITTKSSLKITTSSYYKILNFFFLYCTMLCAIASIPYYGLDYTITNPIGLVPQDRIIDQKISQSDPNKLITETAFLGVNPTDKNSRIRDGVHARRERWKQRLIKYQAYDASLYDQGVYDFLTIEDLNYGFDRFWLRRKMRNHQIRFRLFPGPWMRSLKKQLNNPANISIENSNKAATGPRVEFFRILFEQFYHPNFHDRNKIKTTSFEQPELLYNGRREDRAKSNTSPSIIPEQGSASQSALGLPKLEQNLSSLAGQSSSEISSQSAIASLPFLGITKTSNLIPQINYNIKQIINNKNGINNRTVDRVNSNISPSVTFEQSSSYHSLSGLSNSALRKFVRNFNTRINLKNIKKNRPGYSLINKSDNKIIYSKRWKSIFSKIQPTTKTTNSKSYRLFRNVSQQLLLSPEGKSLKLANINQKLSTKERKILELRNILKPSQAKSNISQVTTSLSDTIKPRPVLNKNKLLLRPLNIYLQKEQAFKRKLRYYGATPMRKLTIGNQAPYFKALMKRGFYFYKPSLRLKKTFYVASMRRGFRKKSRKQQILVMPSTPVELFFLPEVKTERQSSSSLSGKNSRFAETDGLLRAQSTISTVALALRPQAQSAKELNGQTFVHNQKITKPTHAYSVLGKRASRYRHQIYKDVLQHWYYTPFNRLLLKFDVDSFIKRQPKTHFLTKNEERLLHIRRFLLSEHYDTLRWYTYMQHYQTMKTHIGGTKSFATRTYNQQFQGTFKKIRHLFAITPKQGDLYTLKFDQPLYNDNTLKDNVYYHEELLTDNTSNNVLLNGLSSLNSVQDKLNNLTNEYLDQQNTIKLNSNSDKTSRSLLTFQDTDKSSNLSTGSFNINSMTSLTQNGSKDSVQVKREQVLATPSGGAITESLNLIGSNYLNLLEQSSNNAYTGQSLGTVLESDMYMVEPSKTKVEKSLEIQQPENYNFVYSELFVKLIKECKKRVHNQAFLKNYITHRIEKREQLNMEQTKALTKRLEKLKIWLNSEQKLYKSTLQSQSRRADVTDGRRANDPLNPSVTSGLRPGSPTNSTNLKSKPSQNGSLSYASVESNTNIDNTILTTGMQKAINDSLSFLPPKGSLSLTSSPYTYNELNTAYTIKTEEEILTKLNLINSLTVSTAEQPGSKRASLIKLGKTKQFVLNTINKVKPVLYNQTIWLKTKTDKNLNWWRKKQRVITKRKTSRKRDRFKKQLAVVNKKYSALSKKVETEKTNLYTTLYGNYDISDYILTNPVPYASLSPLQSSGQNSAQGNYTSLINSNLLRKKQDNIDLRLGRSGTSKNVNKDIQNKFILSPSTISLTAENQNVWKGFFSKKLRKKASSKGRRYRSLSLARYLTATRKPRLVGFDNLTKMENINNINGSILTKKEKQERLNVILKNKINSNGLSGLDNLKKSQIKKRSRHSWKKRSRHQFNRNHYKYRKRHIHGNGKLRIMNKKLKKFKNTYELRQWWWKSFLPRYLNTFKPLSNEQNTGDRLISTNKNSLEDSDSRRAFSAKQNSSPETWSPSISVNKLSQKEGYLNSAQLGFLTKTQVEVKSSGNYSTTNLPFYAGWDESLRKFVVTNRLYSRRDAGLSVKNTTALQTQSNFSPTYTPEQGSGSPLTKILTNTPIQGLNEGSFLYWQTDMSFNSYNIDQFITTNQSFYAPLGWRRFEFRHSILKTWTTKSQTLSSNSPDDTDGLNVTSGLRPSEKTLIVSLKNLHTLRPNSNSKLFAHKLEDPLALETQKSLSLNLISSKQTKKTAARRIKKRYKLIKQMPNILMYAPTGPLLLEVLPSHYISVFDQQTRFPRNRYLKRNLLKTMKKTTLLALYDSANNTNNFTKEFTFRKRVKPRRKYHRKRFIKKDGLIFPRRTKFVLNSSLNPNRVRAAIRRSVQVKNTSLTQSTSTDFKIGGNNNIQVPEEDLRWRPSSLSKQKRKETLRSKTKSNKRVKTNPLRLRQLRRREFQQIVKPLQRYIPRNGGFSWPGDYLRLEIVEMPKLKSTNVKKTSLKQKINVQPVGIMPRKYLIQKHNIKVLKKKLEKAYSSQQLSNAVKQYKLLIENNF